MTRAPLRVGLIGAGPWGRNLLRTLGGMGAVQVVAVASRSVARSDLPPGAWVLEREWAALLHRGDLDAVVIAVPPTVHGEIVAQALAAGLHVLVEKPLALDAASAAALAGKAARAKRVLMVDHIHLYNPAYQALRARVTDGRRVLGVRSEAGNVGPFRAGVPPLWDWAPHDVALCMDLLGTPAISCYCRCMLHDESERGVGEILELGLSHPGNVQARIRVGNLVSPRIRRFVVYGEDELLLFDDLAVNRLTTHPPAEPFAPVRTAGIALPISSQSPMESALSTFVHRVRADLPAPDRADFDVQVVTAIAALDALRVAPAL